MIKNLHLSYEEFSDWKELSEQDLLLVLEAKKARETAYARYSGFKVGAAVLLENNTTILGNNQENAAYPSGLCAERTAVFYASANYPDSRILRIAVVAGKEEDNDKPIPPCGACRQVLLEYENKQNTPIEFLFTGMKGRVIKFSSCSLLLPFSFNETLL